MMYFSATTKGHCFVPLSSLGTVQYIIKVCLTNKLKNVHFLSSGNIQKFCLILNSKLPTSLIRVSSYDKIFERLISHRSMTTTSYYKKLQFGIWRIFPGFFCQQPKYSSHIMLRTLTTFSMTKYQEMGKIKVGNEFNYCYLVYL